MKTHENGSAREGYSDLKSEGILLNFLKRMSLISLNKKSFLID